MIHVVEQGECLSSLAAQYGFSSWKDLHEHPANADLKKKRPNPNVLAPGDEVEVPDLGPPKVACVAAEKRHRFLVQPSKVKLRVALVDRAGKAQEGRRFVVTVGGRDVEGTTASGGLVEVEVRASETSARLRVWLDDEKDAPPTIDRTLALGCIDPVDTVSGVQGRLSNLGYRCAVSGEIDDDLDDPTLVAARAFRAKTGLPAVEPPEPSGDDPTPDADAVSTYAAQLLDDAFRQRLAAAYEKGGQGS